MIEFVNDKERNLKNLKQIGTPREENKIYIEDFAYAKIKENSYKEKRVFVLMGHTERMEGRYITFIEAVIPIREMVFNGNVPKWDNLTWAEVFREIKKRYEDMIMVGWAIDIKGMLLKVTPELERVHREHFGGVHQLLFLLDTLEQEETFYMYKENKLVPKDGFYIYHRARKKETVQPEEEKLYSEPIPITVLPEKVKKKKQKQKEVDVELEIVDTELKKGGRYRQMIQEQKKGKGSESGNTGLAIAVAMLLFVVGVGVYENRQTLFHGDASVETNLIQGEELEKTDVSKEDEEATEVSGENSDTENGEESQGIETGIEIIPVEIIPGEEIED